MESRWFIMTVLLGLVSGGCSNLQPGYEKSILDWQGREIWLPDVMTDALTGDTIGMADTDFTILTYVDSTGCTGCKMKLRLRDEYMNSVDTISDATVRVLTVVNITDAQELTYILIRDDYGYPVVLDSTDMINVRNRFPREAGLQTFLLDKRQRVIAIGNPVNNGNVARLYKSIISGENTLAPSLETVVRIDSHDIDLGMLSRGEGKTADFKIINDGDDTLHIRGIIPSCPCLKVTVEDTTVLPCTSVNGRVVFEGDSTDGMLDGFIHIYYESSDYPSVVHTRGMVQ